MSIYDQTRIYHLSRLSLGNINYNINELSTKEDKTRVGFFMCEIQPKTRHTSLFQKSYDLLTIGRKMIKNRPIKKPFVDGLEHQTSDGQCTIKPQRQKSNSLGVPEHTPKPDAIKHRGWDLMRHRIVSGLHIRNSGSSKIKEKMQTSQQDVDKRTNSPMGNQSIHGPQRRNSISLRSPIKIITHSGKIKK